MNESKREIKLTIDSLINECDDVFIITHNNPDIDAIASALGIALICQKYKKNYYIVIDNDHKIETGTKNALDDIKKSINVITSDEVESLRNNNSLLLAVDVNSISRICIKDDLTSFKHIIIIDHHNPSIDMINTPYVFINNHLSSTSEEISKLLFAHKIKLSEKTATYLLAGIILDTNKFSRNTSKNTYEVARELTIRGADPSAANNMFLEDFEHDRAMQRIIDNTEFINFNYAVAYKDNSIYDVEDIAKAANYLLKFNVEATFAMAHIDEDTISISARSKGNADVYRVMNELGGGGSKCSSAAKIKGKSIQEIREKLIEIIKREIGDNLDSISPDGNTGFELVKK